MFQLFRRGRPSRLVAGSLLAALLVGMTAVAGLTLNASANNDPMRPIAVNQTDGFGNERVVAFTYSQNFACVHEPFDDLDHNGHVAAVDPNEFQTPICTVGHQSGIDPAGDPITQTEPLYVIVPFFDADGDGEAASPGVEGALNSVLGFVPDAFDPTPPVPVQCPEPGGALTQHHGVFGTCTMHPTTLDLGPVLGQLGLVPADTTVSLPLPNHSHVIDGANFGSIWWQVIVVLVTDPNVWPDVDGTMGITSVAKIREAQANGQASGDVPTNFFLFFDSRQFSR